MRPGGGTLLVTGYEPFADHDSTPSEQLAGRRDGRPVAGRDVGGAVLPVEFHQGADRLREVQANAVVLALERAV